MKTICLTVLLVGLLAVGAGSGCSSEPPSNGHSHKGGGAGASHRGGAAGDDRDEAGGNPDHAGGTGGLDDSGNAGSGVGKGGAPGVESGGAGQAGQGGPLANGCNDGIPVNIIWEDGWMDAADNAETGIQGPWYTYKDARETTTIDPEEKAQVKGNCATAHIETRVTASTDWGAGFACDLNSAGGETPEKNPVAKPLKSLCVDVTIEGGTVDLELPMQDQADADPPFGIPGLKSGANKVDLTKLTKTTWGASKVPFDVNKLISIKFKMNSSSKGATDTTVCIHGISVEL